MEESPDNYITGSTFAPLYNRIAALITINAGVLAIAQWAQAATGPLFRDWVGKTAQILPHRFPGFPPEALASGEALDQIASENHRDAVSDRKSTRLNSSHRCISYAVFC